MTQSNETLISLIDPTSDIEVINYHQEALKLKDYAEKRVIASIEDIRFATDDLSIISKLKKVMEEKRKEYIKPLQEKVKEINGAYKTFMEPIEVADKVTRQKILAFNAEQERQRQEQEEINRLRIEAAQKEMELKGELTESVDLVEVVPEVKRVSTDMGTSGVMKIRKYRVINFAELPDQYKIENSALLNKVVKAGIQEIPGVEIYSEDTLRVTARSINNA